MGFRNDRRAMCVWFTVVQSVTILEGGLIWSKNALCTIEELRCNLAAPLLALLNDNLDPGKGTSFTPLIQELIKNPSNTEFCLHTTTICKFHLACFETDSRGLVDHISNIMQFICKHSFLNFIQIWTRILFSYIVSRNADNFVTVSQVSGDPPFKPGRLIDKSTIKTSLKCAFGAVRTKQNLYYQITSVIRQWPFYLRKSFNFNAMLLIF